MILGWCIGMSKYQIEPDYELDKGCRCLSCWSPTGKWAVTHDDDYTFEMLFDTEEAAKEWVQKVESCSHVMSSNSGGDPYCLLCGLVRKDK